MLMTAILAVLAIAYVATTLLTWMVRAVALRVGLLDKPDEHRKLHSRATPLGGGISVFLATAGLVAAIWFVPSPLREYLQTDTPKLLPLLLAGAVVVVLGTLDDMVGLRGRQKLVGQILAASILMGSGLLIERVVIFNHPFELQLLAIPFTLFWLLGAVNSVNLLDGIDGLATMLGVILSGTIALMAAVTGHVSVGIVAMVFAASLAGFLRFNFPPARVFLGDAGSMLIGLVVGALAIDGSLKGAGTVLLAAPLAVWTLPIFDSVAAILRRKLTGRSIYTSDRGHLQHRLLDQLGSNRRVLALVAVCCTLTSAAALVTVFLKSDTVALVASAALVIVFVATGVFGRAEFSLLASRLRSAVLSLIKPLAPNPSRGRRSAVRLQGSRQWDILWESLAESADKLDLDEIHFDLNIPVVGEGYHAVWKRSGEGQELERCWLLELPLSDNGSIIGRVRVIGRQNGQRGCENAEQLLHLLESFETRIAVMADTGRRPDRVREKIGSITR